jgi:hypothetical protein
MFGIIFKYPSSKSQQLLRGPDVLYFKTPILEADRSASGDRVLLQPESGKSGPVKADFPQFTGQARGAGAPRLRLLPASHRQQRGAAPSLTSRPSCRTSQCHSPAMCSTENSARAERGAFDRETALFVDCEPVGFHAGFCPPLCAEPDPFRRPTGQKGFPFVQ